MEVSVAFDVIITLVAMRDPPQCAGGLGSRQCYGGRGNVLLTPAETNIVNLHQLPPPDPSQKTQKPLIHYHFFQEFETLHPQTPTTHTLIPAALLPLCLHRAHTHSNALNRS